MTTDRDRLQQIRDQNQTQRGVHYDEVDWLLGLVDRLGRAIALLDEREICLFCGIEQQGGHQNSCVYPLTRAVYEEPAQ